jgi:uncharacterized protein (TIGR03437 family)
MVRNLQVGALLILAMAGLYAQPSIAPGGVLNNGSYAKDANGLGSPVAPGSVVAIFGNFNGVTLTSADTVPLSTNLGNVTVSFNGVLAPLYFTSSGQTNAQVPFEALPAGQTTATVNVVLTVNGTPSAPEQTTIVSVRPGVYTIPPNGQSNAIFIFVDPSDKVVKIAAPTSASASIGYPTAPVPRGTAGFFYATGLGGLIPTVADGSGTCPAATGLCQAVTPTVMVGGITAAVAFAGQAPGFPGINQVNITIPQNAPTGNAVPLQIQTADGSFTSTAAATIAIQ